MANENTDLMNIARDNFDDPEIIVKKMNNVLTDIKYKAFGKVKETSKSKVCKELETLIKEKKELAENKVDHNEDNVAKSNEIDSKIAANLLLKQREAFEKELDDIRDLKNSKGTSAAVFSLRERVVGPKTLGQVATAIIDPKTKLEVSEPEEIKRVSLQYCVDLLTNRKPKAEYEEEFNLKKIIHRVRMEEIIEDDILVLTHNMLEATFSALEKKPGNKYNFIMKGGEAVKAALYTLCKLVW